MKLLILTFEQDAMEWFTEKPNNSFNTFESIIVAFKDNFGDKSEDKHLVRDISVVEKKENETVEEFNKRFNGIIKELPQDYRPPARFLFYCYIDAFDVHTSYELRRAKVNDYKVAQVLAEEIEKDKKASGMSKTPDSDRFSTESKGKEVKEFDEDLMHKLMKKIESMELDK